MKKIFFLFFSFLFSISSNAQIYIANINIDTINNLMYQNGRYELSELRDIQTKQKIKLISGTEWNVISKKSSSYDTLHTGNSTIIGFQYEQIFLSDSIGHKIQLNNITNSNWACIGHTTTREEIILANKNHNYDGLYRDDCQLCIGAFIMKDSIIARNIIALKLKNINDSLLLIANKESEQRKILAEQAEQISIKIHLDTLVKKYGSIKGKQIFNGLLFLGYTKQMALDSWGEPEYINKTTTKAGIHEQWVYDTLNHKYLYFDNGILTTIQE